MNVKPYGNPRGRVPKIIEREDVDRLLDLRSAGFSCRQIEREFGCSRMAVWRALKRLEAP